MNEQIKVDGSAEAIKQLVALGTQISAVREFDRKRDDVAGKARFVVLNEGQKVQILEDVPPHAPDRVRCKVDVVDVQSFIRYVTEHKEPDSRIFASVLEEPFGITCALDYHSTPAASLNSTARASFVEHLCCLEFTPTDAWRLWNGNDRKPMGQTEFALFVEENQKDVIVPSGADLLEMAKSFDATQGVSFKRSIRLDNGDTKLLFDDKTEATAGMNGQLNIPSEITLNIPLFLGMPTVNICCRFRYRLDGGQLRMWYEIARKQDLLLRTVQAALDIVSKETQIPYFLGTYRNL